MFTILGADGKEYGPVTASKIQEWITGGRANLETRAKRLGDNEWRTLGEFTEFGAPPPVAEPPPAVLAASAPVAVAPAVELAGRWTRLGAQLIDGLIGSFFVMPGFILLFIAGAFPENQGENVNAPLVAAGGLALCVGLLTIMVIQIFLLSTRGQTIGKKLLGIRIVNLDDHANPGFVRAFLLRMLVNGIIGAVPFIGSAYSIVDICFIFRQDRRCIHDFIAGTQVVNVA